MQKTLCSAKPPSIGNSWKPLRDEQRPTEVIPRAVMAWLHNAMARSRSVSCHLRVQKAPFTVPSRAGLGGTVLFLFAINYSLCSPLYSLSLPRDPFFFFFSGKINHSHDGLGTGAEPVQLLRHLGEWVWLK